MNEKNTQNTQIITKKTSGVFLKRGEKNTKKTPKKHHV